MDEVEVEGFLVFYFLVVEGFLGFDESYLMVVSGVIFRATFGSMVGCDASFQWWLVERYL